MIKQFQSARMEMLLSFVLALFIVNGLLIKLTPFDTSLTNTLSKYLIPAFGATILLFLAFTLVFKSFFSYIETFSNDDKYDQEKDGSLISIRKVLFFSASLFLMWLPYLIICFPCITRGFDFFWQLLQGLSIFPPSSHHPVLSSFVFGLLFKIGYRIGGAALGLFAISLFQTLFMSFAIGFGLAVMSCASKISRPILVCVVLFLGLCPIFPTHAIWLVKDSIFSSLAVMLFSQTFLFIIAMKKKAKPPLIASFPAITVSCLLFALYRNGVTVIAVMLFAMMLLAAIRYGNRKPYYKKWILALICFFVLTASWGTFLDRMNVYPTNAREALSLPTSQIIRTVQLHPDELKDDSIRTVLQEVYHEQVAQGTTVEDIVARFGFGSIDSVKIDYVTDNDVLIQYMKTWIKLGMRHPGSYCDALIRGANRYWDIFNEPYFIIGEGQRISGEAPTESPEEDFASEAMVHSHLSNQFLPMVKSLERDHIDTDVTYEDMFEDHPVLRDLMNVKSAFPKKRLFLRKMISAMEDIPVISVVLTPAFYLWLALICFAYLFSRKSTGRYLWPVLLFELIALMSPVNGYIRYVLPLVIISVLLIPLCFMPGDEKGVQRQREL